MNNLDKLEALKAYLTEKKINFRTDIRYTKKRVPVALYIPKYAITVRIGDNERWYKDVKRVSHPVIIRDQDSSEFVIEKVQNTMTRVAIEKRTRKQRILSAKPSPAPAPAPPKPHRARIKVTKPVKVGSSAI